MDLADSEKMENRDKFFELLQQAILAKDLGSALEVLGKKQDDREELKLQLAWVLARFSAHARSIVDGDESGAERMAQFHRIVMSTTRDLDRNGQPALMLESMVTQLRRV